LDADLVQMPWAATTTMTALGATTATAAGRFAKL